MSNGELAVGFVGAGQMGAPMVDRLLAAGVGVRLFARRPEVVARFERLGATIARSAAALADGVEVLIMCPFSPAQVEEILVGSGGVLAALRPGAVVVQHATVSPDMIRGLATQAAAGGVDLLDAPISGQADDIRSGRLTVLLGGGAAAAARVEPLLSAYSSTILPTGGVGSASVVKLINNLAFAANVQVAVAAAGLGRKLGVDLDLLLRALGACSGNSYAMGVLAAVGEEQRFAEMALPYLRKDVALVEQTVADLGLDTGVLGEIVRAGPAKLVSID